MVEQTVLITGASSGIGKVAARLFADAGFRVFGASRRSRTPGDGVEMLELDVRSDDSVERCVTEALKRTGRIDVLVNNAGVMHEGFAEETKLNDARVVFETNFYGAVRMTNAVLPGMRRRKQGRIINIGSLAAWIGEPGEGFYSASKAALARYTEALHYEVWPLGIYVSLVELGAFRTNVLEAASVSQGVVNDYDGLREPVRRTLHASLRRGADPRKVALAMLRIARSRSPRLHYPAGYEAHWIPYLKVFLPQSLFDYLLRRGYGLPNA